MTFNPNPSLTQQIADFLEREIILGKLKEHERIQEIKYANLLKVSRNSLREALIILERRNLIVISPRKGAFVSALSVLDLQNLIDLIGHLYLLLAKRCAEKWKEDEADALADAVKTIEQIGKEKDVEKFINLAVKFPELLFPVVNNSYLETVVRNLQPASARALYRILSANIAEMKRFMEFLSNVASGIIERDKKGIEKAVTSYVKELKAQIAIYLKA